MLEFHRPPIDGLKPTWATETKMRAEVAAPDLECAREPRLDYQKRDRRGASRQRPRWLQRFCPGQLPRQLTRDRCRARLPASAWTPSPETHAACDGLAST